MARRKLLIAGVLIAVMALVVVGPLEAGAQEGAEETNGEDEPTIVRVALDGYENNLTPFTITFASGRPDDLVMLIYDSLFWSQVSEDPEPWLAQSATPSDDFTSWTIELRPNLTWHDGEPLTAEDVKFTFDYFETAPPGRWTHHVADVPPYEGGEVIDERTVRLDFASPAPTFEILPAADLPILPKHVWENIDDPSTATEDLPVGSGPFELVENVPDQRYRFEANEDYFKGTPLVDVIEMPIVSDPTAAFQALEAGQLDFVEDEVPPGLVDRFEGAEDIEVAVATTFESTELRFNARQPPLTDPVLRKAISLAIDYDALVERVLQGDGQPGNDSWVHPKSPWALPDAEHEYEPERAEQLLDEAGYRPGAGGVREGPDGEPLDFEVLVSSAEPERLRALQLAAEDVSEIGVELEADVIDPATLRERTTPSPDGDPPAYDAQMSGFDWHAHTDPDALYYFFHSPGDEGIGAIFTGWSNREFDQLVERATTLDGEERKPLLHDAQRIMAGEQPLLTFWYRDGVFAYRPASYDGWITDFGHGLLTKRSFLAPYAEASGADAAGDEGTNVLWIVLVVALGAAGAAVTVLLARTRRRRAAEEQGFE